MPIYDTLRPAIGPWVDADRFWNRDHELARFIELLDDGASISLIAPRRVGKTSLMREASNRLRDRYECLHLDLESAHTPAEFFTELLRASRAHASTFDRLVQVAETIVKGIGAMQLSELSLTLRAQMEASWRDRADRFIDALVELDRPSILFLDEVPVFVHRIMCGDSEQPTPPGITQADLFLSWLRRAVQTHQSRLRVVVTGSIGLEPLLERFGLSTTINHYAPVELRPWDEVTARGCLQALARGKDISFAADADIVAVRKLGAAIPHHVQLFFDRLLDHVRRQKARAIFPGDVDEVYRKQMLGVRGHTALAHYETRLDQVLPPAHKPLALALLTHSAAEGRLTAADAARLASDELTELSSGQSGVLAQILGILEHDGYLARDSESGNYRFESNYVRDWWRSRFAGMVLP